MESSVEETSLTSELDYDDIFFEEDANLKATILLDIQNKVTTHNSYFDFKFKYRCVLDDMKSLLLHRRYNKLLFSTVLRELQSSERHKSKLWDDLTSNL